jgi:hypothetical protein
MSMVQDWSSPDQNLHIPLALDGAPQPTDCASALAQAVLCTLAYADLFDYPLTLPELAQYLIGCPATSDEIAAALQEQPALTKRVAAQDGFYFLRGRAAVVETRRARAAVSQRLWPRAARYIRVLRHFPFVRMIAVTGALAVDNVGDNPDIDLLVVCAPGRVWICRRLLIFAVHGIRLLGDEICPNFVLAADSLGIPQQDLFTAHELAQMRPLAGHRVYQTMLAYNAWMAAFLPNTRPWPAPDDAPARPGPITRAAEALLRARPLDRWERWEMARLQRKLGADPTGEGEIACTPHQCKGHTGLYRRHVLQRYEERIAAIADALG